MFRINGFNPISLGLKNGICVLSLVNRCFGFSRFVSYCLLLGVLFGTG